VADSSLAQSVGPYGLAEKRALIVLFSAPLQASAQRKNRLPK